MSDQLPERCCGRCRFWDDYGSGPGLSCSWATDRLNYPAFVQITATYDSEIWDAMTETGGQDCPAFEPATEQENDDA